MARIRTIKPEFFRNFELYETELRANEDRRSKPYLNIRIAFAGLFTASDREGRFRWRSAELKLDTLPYDPIDMDEVLKILSSGKEPYIIRYEVNGDVFGFIPGFPVHQRPKFDEAQSTIPAPPTVLEASVNRPTVVGQSTLGKEVERKGKEGNGVTTASSPPSAVDFSEYRIPFGKRKGVYVLNLPVDECRVYLKSRSLSKQFAAALKWRIALKESEKTEKPAVPGFALKEAR